MARKATMQAEAVQPGEAPVDEDVQAPAQAEAESEGVQSAGDGQAEAVQPGEAADLEPVEVAGEHPAGGELDVEAWVAAVYDYQNNGGPFPERTYRVASAEPVHVDSVGEVVHPRDEIESVG